MTSNSQWEALYWSHVAPSNQPNPLEIAGKVLELDTLLRINKAREINVRGAMILDRWALNDPETLKAVETHSQAGLLMDVITQQRKEAEVLESPRGEELLRNGLAAHEVLEMFGVSMDLKVDPNVMAIYRIKKSQAK